MLAMKWKKVLAKDLAEYMGDHPVTISAWRRGRGMPDEETKQKKLAAYLGVRFNWLILGEGSPYEEEASSGAHQSEGHLQRLLRLLREANRLPDESDLSPEELRDLQLQAEILAGWLRKVRQLLGLKDMEQRPGTEEQGPD